MANQPTDCLVVYNCWQCPKCKFFTPLLKNKCNSCGKICHFNRNKRVEKLEARNDDSGNTNKIINNKWKCTWCSMYNDTRHNDCQVCGQVRHIHIVKTVQKDQQQKEPDINCSKYRSASDAVHFLNLKNKVPYGQSSNVIEQENPPTVQQVMHKEPTRAENCAECSNKILHHRNETVSLSTLKYVPREQFDNDVVSKNQQTAARQLIDTPKQETSKNFNSNLEPERRLIVSRQLFDNNRAEIRIYRKHNRKLVRPPILDNYTSCGHLHDVEPVSRPTVVPQSIDEEAIISEDYSSNGLPYPQHILDKLTTADRSVTKLYDNVAADKRPIRVQHLLHKKLNLATISEEISNNTMSYPTNIDNKEIKTISSAAQQLPNRESTPVVVYKEITNIGLPYPKFIMENIQTINDSVGQAHNIVDSENKAVIEDCSKYNRFNSKDIVDESQISNNCVGQTQEIVSQNDDSQTSNNFIDFEWINDIKIEDQPTNDVQFNRTEEKESSMITMVQQFFKIGSKTPVPVTDNKPNNSSGNQAINEQLTAAQSVSSPETKHSWQCQLCTLTNPLAAKRCEACHTRIPDNATEPEQADKQFMHKDVPEVQSNGWQCPTCTLVNPLTRASCAACHEKRTQIIIQNKQNEQFWLCSQCTLANPLSFDNCELCAHLRPTHLKERIKRPRKKSKQIIAPQRLVRCIPDNSWPCPACTFENPTNLKNCQMCEQERAADSSDAVQQNEAHSSKDRTNVY